MSSTAYIKQQRRVLFEEQRRKCWFCGRFSWNPLSSIKFGSKRPDTMFTVDHILPKCCGGRDNSFNFVGACKACNLKRSEPLRRMLCKIPRNSNKRKEIIKLIAPPFYDDVSSINIRRTRNNRPENGQSKTPTPI